MTRSSRYLTHLAVLALLALTIVRAGPVKAGDGWASTWAGPGAATHDCVWPWDDCQTRAVRSLQTGIVIVVRPTMFCLCVVRPPPHPHRLIDLDPAMVAALGLDSADGLFAIEVWPVAAATGLPDTAAVAP